MGGKGILLAWALGLGILAWRDVRQYHKPPVPGRLLAASGVFAGLALLHAYDPAARAATVAAWGFDVAVLLKPGLLPGTGTTAAPAAAGEGAAAAGEGGGGPL